MTDLACELCGEKAVKDTRPMEYTYKGHQITLDQPGVYCDSCGEVLLDAKDLAATRVGLMDFHAGVDNLLGPSRIKAIRKALKKTQGQLAEILGGGPNAFSRYERGITAVPRSVSVAMKLMEKHPEDIEEVAQKVPEARHDEPRLMRV